jgi:hypothetical protein
MRNPAARAEQAGREIFTFFDVTGQPAQEIIS